MSIIPMVATDTKEAALRIVEEGQIALRDVTDVSKETIEWTVLVYLSNEVMAGYLAHQPQFKREKNAAPEDVYVLKFSGSLAEALTHLGRVNQLSEPKVC